MNYDALLTGKHFMDGMDLWTVYSLFVEGGSDDFLKYAAAKEGISHDWTDAHGVDVDLSRRFLAGRNISLKCGMLVASEAEFWLKYEALLNHLMKPEKRRIEVAEFGDRSFYVYYKDVSSLGRFTKIKDSDLIGIKFTLNLVENEPQLDNTNTFIVDETGRFLIT
ncbi:hypothetical protein [Flaviaesturariibacter amylovorans]|uniref:Uncharacterized protein n=1 Tax=Flaviaesturariibacter amylovorans TaxID=1084520 RepID=A0ABP8GR83_9BACT